MDSACIREFSGQAKILEGIQIRNVERGVQPVDGIGRGGSEFWLSLGGSAEAWERVVSSHAFNARRSRSSVSRSYIDSSRRAVTGSILTTLWIRKSGSRVARLKPRRL